MRLVVKINFSIDKNIDDNVIFLQNLFSNPLCFKFCNKGSGGFGLCACAKTLDVSQSSPLTHS